MSAPRVYGCRASDYSSRLVGSGPTIDLPTPASSIDLTALCTYVDDQVGEECVGEAFSGAHWMALRGRTKRASKRGIYVGARVRERARKTDPITDIGCDPQDAIDGLVTVGAYPLDARDTDPSAVSDMDTWDEQVLCQPFAPEHFLPIARGDTDTLDAVLTAGYPVVNWFFVDDTWSALTAGSIWNGIVNAPRGGHATVNAGYGIFQGRKAYRIWNSYGPDWAAQGFGLVDAQMYSTGQVGMVAVLGGPVL